ncbi:hypothetical protein RM531_07500 [Salinisphaera sp. P385]|uniref:Uncharacterized protein n=1 Tax=Spectribacter acetivorans TaxID=3075603 RepID=A0ABU3B938_9GAMM|nr:hypothetical protein [Salinisphaera sp. P385]MDT0618317.1 hypothetical protein [Salinisphaera sp. P385]
MNDLAHIVEIYRAIRDTKQVDGTTEAYLDVSGESMRLFLLQAEDEDRSEELGLAILSAPEDVQIGAAVNIRLFPPRSTPVYRNLEVFLGNGARLLSPIGEFYIVDLDWFSEDPGPPAEGENLKPLHSVLQQLCDSATLVDKDKTRLLFADSAGLVDLPINISPTDLNAITPESSDAFVEFCADSLHRKHRLEAVAKVVIRQTRGISANNRIHHVFRNLDVILSDAKSQHAVFLSAFSYEKVRDEVEALKVEYTSRIHKVLSSIQGQLLGIPAATVVVATQMKKADVMGAVFITNAAVLLGAFIFGIFLILLLVNQGHTLEVIKTEVARQKGQLKSELLEVADGFEAAFLMLERRINHQRLILWIVGVVVGVGLLLSCIAFWMLNSTIVKSMLDSVC